MFVFIHLFPSNISRHCLQHNNKGFRQNPHHSFIWVCLDLPGIWHTNTYITTRQESPLYQDSAGVACIQQNHFFCQYKENYRLAIKVYVHI